MPEKCDAGIPGCEWTYDIKGMSYAKSDEVLTRHLRVHQIMETRRLADALLAVLGSLAPTRYSVSPQPTPASPEPAVDRVPEVVTPEVVAQPSGTQKSGNSVLCPDCGFRLGGSTCQSIHAKSTAGARA
jgi:hypothetical protein